MRSRDNKARTFRLPAGAGTAQESTPGRYGTRLRLGNYIADIIPDRDDHPMVHHWIVQGVDSPKIICLGQESTFAAALEYGHLCLEALARTHGNQDRAIGEFVTTCALKECPTARRSPARAPSSGLQRPSSRRKTGSGPDRSE